MLGKNTGTNKINTKKNIMCRDQCGSVGWASSCKTKVAGSILGRGACLGCGPGPQSGACKRQPMDVSFACQCVSPFSYPSLPLSKSK